MESSDSAAQAAAAEHTEQLSTKSTTISQSSQPSQFLPLASQPRASSSPSQSSQPSHPASIQTSATDTHHEADTPTPASIQTQTHTSYSTSQWEYPSLSPNPNAPAAPPSPVPSDKPEQDSSPSAHIDRAILHPGSVKINVRGAFIVDETEEMKRRRSEEEAKVKEELWRGGRDDGGVHYEHKDIRLPNQMGVVSHVAVDIGGSLAKLVYFTREPSDSAGGRLNFINFETDRIDLCINFIKRLKEKHNMANGLVKGKGTGKGGRAEDLCVMATGGGAFKYYERIKRELEIDVKREDEMECLIIGLDFFITEIPREVFTFSESNPMQFAEARADIYPYLLVNIGSGVSMIKVSGPRRYERIGGTSLGGGTLWGILSLLTGARSFDEMLELAQRGDNAGVDMLVGDIYGTDYGKIGLKSTTIASTFGKVFKLKRSAERNAESQDGDGMNGDSRPDDEENEDNDMNGTGNENTEGFSPADMSRSLLYAISNNIGQIAYLQSEKHSLRHIYFGGSFIRGHKQTMNTLSYAIKFWSRGEKQAYFLRHEGYLGSVGAFLKRQPRNWGRRNSLEVEGGGWVERVQALREESPTGAGAGLEEVVRSTESLSVKETEASS